MYLEVATAAVIVITCCIYVLWCLSVLKRNNAQSFSQAEHVEIGTWLSHCQTNQQTLLQTSWKFLLLLFLIAISHDVPMIGLKALML